MDFVSEQTYDKILNDALNKANLSEQKRIVNAQVGFKNSWDGETNLFINMNNDFDQG